MQLTNFRDLGGWVGHEGKKVKGQIILRAGEPVGLCDADLAELRDVYRLAHIIDFRGEKEIVEKPVDEIEGAQYVNIDIMASQMKKGTAPSLEEIVSRFKTGDADSFMTEAYTNFVVSEDALIGYRQFIEVLLNAKGALLFHCFAGKDRTGWGAAILLKLLGVAEEDIMTDYLATIEGRKTANAVLVDALRNKGFGDEQLVVYEEMMSVKPTYLQTAFDVVKEHHGTFDNYLRDALHVTDTEIEQLRELYLI